MALLLAIKERGKRVDFEHILDRVGRDVAFAEGRKLDRGELEAVLKELESSGLVRRFGEEFEATSKIDDYVGEAASVAERLNRSYLLVWKAKHYYPRVAEAMLPFLRDRAVSAVKIFSGKINPLDDLNTIFVRYRRYKPKPIPLTISSKEDLMELVFDHCIDFVPYVHKLDSNEPDIFVLDLDAGAEILKRPNAYDFIKYVAGELYDLLSELGIGCMVKFSGSRGFQIWASFDNGSLRRAGDVFRVYRDMAVETQRRLEDRLQAKIEEVRSLFPDMVFEGEPITTSQVAHKNRRMRQILVDWSVLKPMGDVRAPFSIHHKTGLASIPIPRRMLGEFRPEDAEPFKVIDKLEIYRGAATISISDPKPLAQSIVI